MKKFVVAIACCFMVHTAFGMDDSLPRIEGLIVKDMHHRIEKNYVLWEALLDDNTTLVAEHFLSGPAAGARNVARYRADRRFEMFPDHVVSAVQECYEQHF